MRSYRRLQIHLARKDRQVLQKLRRGGIQQVRVVLRALALVQLAGGQSPPQVASNLGLTAKAVRAIGWRYEREGLARALYEKPRPGAAPLLEPAQRQRIVALVCSDPPEGRARWTVRLIVQEAVKRKLVPKVGRETIRVLLESHDLKPWRGENVARGQAG